MAQQAQQLLIDHVKSPVPSPAVYRRDLPPALERLVVEMLSKRPDERPSSIEVVSAMLRSIRANLGRSGAVRPLDVLIVDDDATVREIVERFVRAAAPDATVRFAADGIWMGLFANILPADRDALRTHLRRLTYRIPGAGD